MKIGSIIVAFLVIIVLANAFYIVDETKQAVITQFGRPVGEAVTTPGLKVKIPFIQKANLFDRRFLEWDGIANQLPTRDKRFILVNTYARWRITDPLLFFQRLRDETGAQTRLDDIIEGETRNAIANYDVVEVVRTSNRTPEQTGLEEEERVNLEPIELGRDVIRKEILKTAQSRTSDLGIEILDVQFKRINYVVDVERKVYDRMISERERIADRYRSQGEGEAMRIRGDKERELLQIRSQAYRTAEEVRGHADAEATGIYAAAYGRNAQTKEFYQFLKTLETYPETFDAKTTLVLSSDGEFYHYLTSQK